MSPTDAHQNCPACGSAALRFFTEPNAITKNPADHPNALRPHRVQCLGCGLEHGGATMSQRQDRWNALRSAT